MKAPAVAEINCSAVWQNPAVLHHLVLSFTNCLGNNNVGPQKWITTWNTSLVALGAFKVTPYPIKLQNYRTARETMSLSGLGMRA